MAQAHKSFFRHRAVIALNWRGVLVPHVARQHGFGFR
jgi:hypothetical protein